MQEIRIPTRFEMVLGASGLDPTPLIVGVEDDLQALDGLRNQMRTQRGGALSFLTGESGVGKTTAVYSAAALQPENYEPVFLVPGTVPLRELGEWVGRNLPAAKANKTIPVLFDNREATDDKVGLKQLMSSLNGLSRQRPDLMMLWPTTDDEWRDELHSVAFRIGRRSFVPGTGTIKISGPPSQRWAEVLDRLLIQLDQSFDDLALSPETVAEAAERESSVGDFLEVIRDHIAARLSSVQLAKALPRLLFVVTSDSAVVGEANRLRRARSLNIKADELLSYSPRSESGKYWKARLTDPEHHLAYIIALFQARLVTMTPSSVVYAALEFGDSALAALPKDAGATKNAGNANRTFQNTDFYKLLAGMTDYELTSTTKGQTSPVMQQAYAAVQAASSKRHKVINQSICALAERNVPGFEAGLGRFEVDLGDANAFADAVIPWDGEDIHLEFHHLSEAHCRASSMSSYMMEKLQTYAIHYNLIPR